MGSPSRCPRCGATLHPPGVWESAWSCPRHGQVPPMPPAHDPTQAWLDDVASRARVPVWLPWPMPAGWLFSGIGEAGAPQSGPEATVVACSGPNPAPNPGAPHERSADLLLVAESPGVGLGAHLSGLDDVDPGTTVGTGPCHATVRADGHVSSLWCVPGTSDRAAYVGEAGGVWLYLVLWPATAGVLLAETLHLRDVRGGREGRGAVQPPFGARSPRLP